MISIEQRDNILTGLEIAFEKLLEFKKQKNSGTAVAVVVMRGDKILNIKPEDYSSQNNKAADVGEI